MKKKRMMLAILLLLLIPAMTACGNRAQGGGKELLHITALAYRNGENYDDGVIMVPYVYDVEKKEVKQLAEIPCQADYPISYYDYRNEKIYYSNAEEGEPYDNLYVYDTVKQTETRLTDGKFVFNDFFMRDGNLICNVAPQYSTVTKPAIYNVKENTFQYYKEEDDDTWCHSLSYYKSGDKLLMLACSDAEMRSAKVCEETFIRPKTIYRMNPDFQEVEKIYDTDKFEVRSARQLDDSRIMIAVDPRMGWEYTDRTLKVLNVETREETDVEIPDLQAIQSFYPRDNAEGVFVYGQDGEGKVSIFYYEFDTKNLRDVLEGYDFPDAFCGIVDFLYSCD